MSAHYFNTFRNEFQFDQTLTGLFTDPDNPIPFAYGTNGNSALLVNTVQFGDGYEQRGPSGINPKKDTYTLLFEKKRDPVVAALRAFFLGQPVGRLYNRNPAEPFYILLPPPLMLATDQPKKFVVEDSIRYVPNRRALIRSLPPSRLTACE